MTDSIQKTTYTLNGVEFNPYEHFTQIKGRDNSAKDYLPVAWRLAWFRAARPKGRIRTEIIEHDKEIGFILIKAYVDDNEGGLAEAYGSCNRSAFKDYIEKAETKAKGRALADLGYGTQFAEELDEEEALADTPLPAPAPRPEAKPVFTRVESEVPSAHTLREKAQKLGMKWEDALKSSLQAVIDNSGGKVTLSKLVAAGDELGPGYCKRIAAYLDKKAAA